MCYMRVWCCAMYRKHAEALSHDCLVCGVCWSCDVAKVLVCKNHWLRSYNLHKCAIKQILVSSTHLKLVSHLAKHISSSFSSSWMSSTLFPLSIWLCTKSLRDLGKVDRKEQGLIAFSTYWSTYTCWVSSNSSCLHKHLHLWYTKELSFLFTMRSWC
jgi:hypothetical protein